jgi:hypothetical protein
VLLVVACVLAAAPAAPAKEGVVARVLTPIPRDAPAGTTLTVVWTLSFMEGGVRRPFGACGVFIRLFGADGARSRRAYATELEPGRFRARATVPRGGVERVVIGLVGVSCAATCRAAPVHFPLAGRVFR